MRGLATRLVADVPLSMGLLLRKILLNAKLDFQWLARGPVSPAERLSYIAHKYAAIGANHSRIKFQGHDFHYDNRLTPALLPDYLFEIRDLESKIDFGQMRTVLDIGANVGQFAYVLKSRHPHLGIFSFEPNPEIFPLLEQNAAHFTNWTCFNFGLGEKNRSVPFYFVRGKSGQGSFYRENAVQGLLTAHIEQIEIAVRSIGEIRDLPPHFDFIKIDVEGAEIGVLESIAQLSWTYVYVELSANRGGKASTEDALRALNMKAELIHAAKPAGQSGTFQALFRRNSV